MCYLSTHGMLLAACMLEPVTAAATVHLHSAPAACQKQSRMLTLR